MPKRNQKQNAREQLLRDPQFAVYYFLTAAQAGNPELLRMAVKNILETGGDHYWPVKLTKISACPDAIIPAGEWSKFKLGKSNDASLPIDYTLTGILVRPICIGSGVTVLRLTRNGIAVPGLFQSTVVSRLGDEGFMTQNSVYLVEFVT
jgi:hypothetical protein